MKTKNDGCHYHFIWMIIDEYDQCLYEMQIKRWTETSDETVTPQVDHSPLGQGQFLWQQLSLLLTSP